MQKPKLQPKLAQSTGMKKPKPVSKHYMLGKKKKSSKQ